MKNDRVVVQLLSDSAPEPVLLATLNRFHFKSLFLAVGIRSNHVLSYSDKIDERSRQAVVLPNTSENHKLNELKHSAHSLGIPLLQRDYLSDISRYFDRYLHSTEKLDNWAYHCDDQKEPSADILADAFEGEVLNALGIAPRKTKARFALAMTHDVDYLGSYVQGNVQSGLMLLYNAFRKWSEPDVRKFYLSTAVRFLRGRVDYYGFDQIAAIARRQGFRPTFFLFARLPHGNQLTWWERIRRLNPNYGLDHPDMVRARTAMVSVNAEIGIHGSYHSANDEALLRNEREQLQSILGIRCVSSRQHYLNFFRRTSIDLYSRIGIEYDSTCGFIAANGYLCGTTRPFYAVMPGKKQNQVIVLPMTFMDAVPLYFKPEGIRDTSRYLQQMLAHLKKHHGFAAVNFHQRMISCIPEYRRLYEDLAAETKAMGGQLATFNDMNELYPECTFSNNVN